MRWLGHPSSARQRCHGCRLPAPPEEVALRQVDGADEAVHRRVAAAEAEQPGRLLGHVHVNDDLGLVRPRLRRDVHLLEVSEVHELLACPLLLLQGVQVTLVQRDLTPQDLVLAADVAGNVDPLDVDLRPLGDLEGDVEDVLAGHRFRLRRHFVRGSADRAVESLDGLDAVADGRPVEDVTGLEADLPHDLLLWQERQAGRPHLADTELGPLDHGERDRHQRPLAVHLDVRRLDAGLDVAVIVVEQDDPLDVLVESLPLDLTAEDEVLPLARREVVLDERLAEPRVALDDDLVDLDLPPLGDAEHHAHVAVGELLDVRGDLHLEVALVLVEVAQLPDRALDVHRVVDPPQLEIDLFLEVLRLQLLVAREAHVTHERPLLYDEGDLDAALEVLDPHLHVIEESKAEDRADVLRQEVRVEGGADGALHAAEDDGVLDAPGAFDRELLDDDGGLSRCWPLGSRELGEGEDDHHDDDNGETDSTRCRHRALRSVRTAS